MRFFNFINRFFAAIGSWLQSPLLFLLRLYFGIGLMMAGFGKLQDIGKFTDYLISLNIPYPEVGAWLAALSEFVGGALLVIGFLSRFVSIPIIITMAVAYSVAHADAFTNIWDSPKVFVEQGAFNYLLTALLVFAFGPGCWSVDALISDRNCTTKIQMPSK